MNYQKQNEDLEVMGQVEVKNIQEALEYLIYTLHLNKTITTPDLVELYKTLHPKKKVKKKKK